MESGIALRVLMVDLTLLLTSLALIIWLVIIRSVRKKRIGKKTSFIKSIDSKINKFLISSSENVGLRFYSVRNYQVGNLASCLNVNARKDALLKRLLQLKPDLHGEFDELLARLYHSLNLFKRSVTKVDSLSIRKKIEGVDEISQFNHPGALTRVKKLLLSRYLFVRQMAQMALIRLSRKDIDPLVFLSSHACELTDWHQLQIHFELSQGASKHLIKIEKLLLHPSAKVKIFALKLCILYQRVELMSLIRDHILSDSFEVRIWVLRAISEMGDDSDITAVVNLLRKRANDQEISACLKALGQIGGKEELAAITPFCESKIRAHRLEAVSAIQQITNGAHHFLRSYYPDALPTGLITTIKHIEEPLNQAA